MVFSMILLIIPSFLFSQNEEDIEAQALNIFNNYKDGVIILKSIGEDDSVIFNGTGFAVGEKIIATNYHLISMAKSIEGTTADGKPVKIKGIVDYDKETNIALLEINKKIPVLSIGEFESLEFGSKVFLIGANQIGQIRAYPGKIINIGEPLTNIKVADSSIDAGDEASGGPVFSENGQVVGIIFYPTTSSSKIIIPISVLNRVNKDSTEIKVKSMEKEDYFSTLEGAYFTGHSFAAVNNMIIAEDNLKKVAELNPNDLETKMVLGGVLTRGRAFSSAVSIYKDITELDPESDEAYLKMGTVYTRCLGIYFGFFLGTVVFPVINGFRKVKISGNRIFFVFTAPIVMDTIGNLFHLWQTSGWMRYVIGLVWGTLLPYYFIAGLSDLFLSRKHFS